MLAALERRRVAYIVVGELAEVLQGSGGTANTIQIVPSLRPENVERIRAALSDLGTSPAVIDRVSEADLVDGTTVACTTPSGELLIVPAPEGTRGWDDLRRGAGREPLGGGVRPAIAGVDDLVRMNEATGVPERAVRARTLRRMIELSHDRGIDL